MTKEQIINCLQMNSCKIFNNIKILHKLHVNNIYLLQATTDRLFLWISFRRLIYTNSTNSIKYVIWSTTTKGNGSYCSAVNSWAKIKLQMTLWDHNKTLSIHHGTTWRIIKLAHNDNIINVQYTHVVKRCFQRTHRQTTGKSSHSTHHVF